MEAEKEVATNTVTHLDGLAGARVELYGGAMATLAGGHAQPGRALAWQADAPVASLRLVGLQVGNGAPRGVGLGYLGARDFRLHPVVEFLVEYRQGAGDEDGEQQPAENQPGPGVQPGHRLGEGVLHASHSSACGQKPIRASGTATASGAQARRASLHAKAQRMAAV